MPPALDDSILGPSGGSLFERPQRPVPPTADGGGEPDEFAAETQPQRRADSLPPRTELPPQRTLPQRGGFLPQRGVDSLLQRTADSLRQSAAAPVPPLPPRPEAAVQQDAEPLPQLPHLPQRSDSFPQRSPEPPSQRGTEPSFPGGAEVPSRQEREPFFRRGPETLSSRGTDSLPQRAAEPLPQRGAEALPQRGAEALPQRGADSLSSRGTPPLPQRGAEPLPQRGAEALPQRGAESLPPRGIAPLPQRGSEAQAPRGTAPLPQRGADSLPQRGADSLPPRSGTAPLPQRDADSLPQRGGEALPQRGGNGALPRRIGRSRPGRHRSPHRLSVASDAPSLILAVPGSASGDYATVVEEIAAIAETSCPGIEIRVGFLEGEAFRLADCLNFDSEPTGEHPLNGVIVPLLAGPHPASDAALARAVDEAGSQVMLGAPLGPHPLIAEALHARLAEAGLARQARSRGLSISTSTYGVLVLADRGDDAVATAGVAAVLLTSRLTMPAAPASIDDMASIDSALARLREAGADRPVIAPCVIGPETPRRDLEAVSSAVGAPCAAPLGSHAAVGQLVAIRYGAALARLSMAG
jgi:sirohydrochlorin ferrochelatase